MASGDMTIYSMPIAAYEGEGFRQAEQAPGHRGVACPHRTFGYSGRVTLVSEDDMFRGPGTVGGEIVNTSMDFDTAKALTKAFIDNLDSVYRKKTHSCQARSGEIDVAKTDAGGLNPIKYHPGAVAAWEEAGYKLPDLAK